MDISVKNSNGVETIRDVMSAATMVLKYHTPIIQSSDFKSDVQSNLLYLKYNKRLVSICQRRL